MEELKAQMQRAQEINKEFNNYTSQKHSLLKLLKDFNEKIAILRFDGDWYESTIDVLENMYDNVVDGGVIIFDDYYYWNGNKRGVDDFMKNKPYKQYYKTGNGEMWFIK
jgi:hypothetical protein